MKHKILYSLLSTSTVGAVTTAIALPIVIINKAHNKTKALLSNFAPLDGKDNSDLTKSEINMVSIGDSITAGYNGSVIDEDKHYFSYADLLKENLENAGKKVNYFNEAISGARIMQIHEQILNDEGLAYRLSKADLVTVSLGGNDFIEVLKIAGISFDQLFQLFGNTAGEFLPSNTLRDAKETIPLSSKYANISEAAGIVEAMTNSGSLQNLFGVNEGLKDTFIDLIERKLLTFMRDLHEIANNAKVVFVWPPNPFSWMNSSATETPLFNIGDEYGEISFNDVYQIFAEKITELDNSLEWLESINADELEEFSQENRTNINKPTMNNHFDIHPTSYGHQVIANHIFNQLFQYLELTTGNPEDFYTYLNEQITTGETIQEAFINKRQIETTNDDLIDYSVSDFIDQIFSAILNKEPIIDIIWNSDVFQDAINNELDLSDGYAYVEVDKLDKANINYYSYTVHQYDDINNVINQDSIVERDISTSGLFINSALPLFLSNELSKLSEIQKNQIIVKLLEIVYDFKDRASVLEAIWDSLISLGANFDIENDLIAVSTPLSTINPNIDINDLSSDLLTKLDGFRGILAADWTTWTWGEFSDQLQKSNSNFVSILSKVDFGIEQNITNFLAGYLPTEAIWNVQNPITMEPIKPGLDFPDYDLMESLTSYYTYSGTSRAERSNIELLDDNIDQIKEIYEQYYLSSPLLDMEKFIWSISSVNDVLKNDFASELSFLDIQMMAIIGQSIDQPDYDPSVESIISPNIVGQYGANTSINITIDNDQINDGGSYGIERKRPVLSAQRYTNYVNNIKEKFNIFKNQYINGGASTSWINQIELFIDVLENATPPTYAYEDQLYAVFYNPNVDDDQKWRFTNEIEYLTGTTFKEDWINAGWERVTGTDSNWDTLAANTPVDPGNSLDQDSRFIFNNKFTVVDEGSVITDAHAAFGSTNAFESFLTNLSRELIYVDDQTPVITTNIRNNYDNTQYAKNILKNTFTDEEIDVIFEVNSKIINDFVDDISLSYGLFLASSKIASSEGDDPVAYNLWAEKTLEEKAQYVFEGNIDVDLGLGATDFQAAFNQAFGFTYSVSSGVITKNDGQNSQTFTTYNDVMIDAFSDLLWTESTYLLSPKMAFDLNDATLAASQFIRDIYKIKDEFLLNFS